MIRVPIEPLERWFKAAHPPTNHSVAEQEELLGAPTARRLAEDCGVSEPTIWRWRREGIPYWSADAAATALGLHPTALWGDWMSLDPSERRTRWPLRGWWVERKRAAYEESVRLRAECVGSAGVLARRMLDIPEPTESAA